jgi:2-dehydropantoate 2-reductase
MLARAGFDVHFLRSEYQAVCERGLSLDSAVHGALHMRVQASSAADMPPCDWPDRGQGHQQRAAGTVDRAGCGARRQGGAAAERPGVEEQLRPALRSDMHLLGGLCFICVNRQAPGVIRHQALGAVNLGYHSGPATDCGVALVKKAPGCSRRRASTRRPCRTWPGALAEAGVERATVCRCCWGPAPRH